MPTAQEGADNGIFTFLGLNAYYTDHQGCTDCSNTAPSTGSHGPLKSHGGLKIKRQSDPQTEWEIAPAR